MYATSEIGRAGGREEVGREGVREGWIDEWDGLMNGMGWDGMGRMEGGTDGRTEGGREL